jgi:hypothetical protein
MYIFYIFILISKLSNLKKLLLAAVSSILLMVSCKKQNTPYLNNNGGGKSTFLIDRSYYFKIAFDNTNLFNYAVFLDSSGILTYWNGASGATATVGSSTGSNNTLLTISGNNINAAVPNSSNCDLVWTLIKTGDTTTGLYKKIINFINCQIYDQVNLKYYYVDTSSTVAVYVSSIGLHNITGTIQCKLIDGNTLNLIQRIVPAVGSFNLYKP